VEHLEQHRSDGETARDVAIGPADGLSSAAAAPDPSGLVCRQSFSPPRLPMVIASAPNETCVPAASNENLHVRILVVEDDKKTGAFIAKALKAEGYAVDVLRNGDEALAAIEGTPFDAVILDIMLIGRDGLSVLKQMRAGGRQTPVLLLSARGQVNERVEGLNAGAEDYMAKPFALEELVARVRALVRRGGDAKSSILRVGDLKLDTFSRVAERGGRRIELTAREYRLLECLMRSAGRVCSRMMILEKVWDYSFDPGSNLVDVYICKLRDKIDADGEAKLLHSVRGEGYVIREGP
jgi:DNA-binding response OmpR family regulator